MELPPFSAPLPVSLSGGRSYEIFFRPLADAPALMEEAGLRRGRCLVVTDEQVGPLYAERLQAALRGARWHPLLITVPAGETTKAYEHLHAIYDAALSWGIDRKTPVLALGGGVVGDLAGFAAATLLRGLPLVQLPTTLIAQVDSAIGGKTGINHATGKNLIGAFHQPALVCTDVSTLGTLPDREWTSGLAEVVKHALIADPALYGFLEDAWPAILARSPELVPELVHRAVAVKTGVVSEDEKEQGRRAILNFGHTFGHAIERVAGYGAFTHGEAVALGMRAALHLSHQLNPSLPLARINDLILHLPTPPHLVDISTESLMAAMQTDKKVDAGVLRLVLLRRLGDAYVTPPPPSADIEAAWNYAKQRQFAQS